MKYLICCFWVLFMACKEKPAMTAGDPSGPAPSDSVLVRLMGGNQAVPDSCVYVSRSLENDVEYNSLLRKYICDNLYGNDSLPRSGEFGKLAKRESFLKMILLFYGNDHFEKISFYDEKSRLKELRKNLLFGMKNCCIDQLHGLADTLMTIGNFDGLEVLWGIADLQKLPHLKSYLIKVDTGNFFVYADLSAFFHNSGNPALRDTFLNKAKQIQEFKKEYYSLDTLISNNKKFDNATYKELIYGGL